MCRSYGAKIYLVIIGYKHDAPTEQNAVSINLAINVILLWSLYFFWMNLVINIPLKLSVCLLMRFR